jgi:hypothetical protein
MRQSMMEPAVWFTDGDDRLPAKLKVGALAVGPAANARLKPQELFDNRKLANRLLRLRLGTWRERLPGQLARASQL